MKESASLGRLRETWLARWEASLEAWSRFTKLEPPRWCYDVKDEKREGLEGSFAMIRLVDHAVVISLKQVEDLKLAAFPREILAHEIGHHVYAPADLADNARLLARVRVGLPTREHLSGFIANLYTDLLINDRLQRSAGLDMAGVYERLRVEQPDRVWTLYMRIYEVLWSLPSGALTPGEIDDRIQVDAQLGARLVRAYARDWLEGAGRFACLFLPYLAEDKNYKKAAKVIVPWLDSRNAGECSELPDGLAVVEEGELEGAIHPAEDEELAGLGLDGGGEDSPRPNKGGRATIGGRKNNYRSPTGYVELMQSLGVKVGEKEMIVRYYRELAAAHVVRFPCRLAEEATDPLPEGLDVWEPGAPLADLDWMESATRSPYVIPGVTTFRRLYGASPGNSPERRPVDLYLGVDCSGSMGNPAYNLSYPVLAGAVLVLSALRAGARVKACLSGEPGEFSETDGFLRDEREILKILTGYLGTGYAFGALRLKDTFLKGEKLQRPTHILLVSDSDWFYMLKEVKGGWEIVAEAVRAAGGGATAVLNLPGGGSDEDRRHLEECGWDIHLVSTEKELVDFARAFSRRHYEDERRGRAEAV